MTITLLAGQNSVTLSHGRKSCIITPAQATQCFNILLTEMQRRDAPPARIGEVRKALRDIEAASRYGETVSQRVNDYGLLPSFSEDDEILIYEESTAPEINLLNVGFMALAIPAGMAFIWMWNVFAPALGW